MDPEEYVEEENVEEEEQPKRVIDASGIEHRLLPGVNLTGVNLTGVDLTDVDLAGAILTNAILTNVNLNDVDLTGAILTGANLTNVNLTRVDLTYVNFADVKLTNVNFTDVEFKYNNFVYINNDSRNRYIPANLADVIWPRWWEDVLINDIVLTPDQMGQLYIRNPFERAINPFDPANEYTLEKLKHDFAEIRELTREEQIESMRKATSNLQSRAEQLATELEDKPARGYGKCGICLEYFQLNDIVIDVHPSNNKPYDRHRFHKNCLMNYCKNTKNPICPLCKDPKDPIKCESENIKNAGKVIELKEGEQTGEVIMRTLQGGKRKSRKFRKSRKSRKSKKSRKFRKSRKSKKSKRRKTNKKYKK